jgi:drug/metabolite transporter (DMT)-like permease
VILAAASQILLKLGANSHVAESWVDFTQLASGWVWLGIIATIGSLVYWLIALRRIELNVAYNLSGLLHVLVPIGSWTLLGEHISIRQWMGISLVFIGVMLTAQTCAHVESEEHR